MLYPELSQHWGTDYKGPEEKFTRKSSSLLLLQWIYQEELRYNTVKWHRHSQARDGHLPFLSENKADSWPWRGWCKYLQVPRCQHKWKRLIGHKKVKQKPVKGQNPHDHLNRYKKNPSDKIQYLVMIEVLNKLRIEDYFLNMMKSLPTTVNMVKDFNAFLLRSETRQGLLVNCTQDCTGGSRYV